MAIKERKMSASRPVRPAEGRPLKEFRSSKEFVAAICDAMGGLGALYTEAGIVHGDINDENIMIKDGGGILFYYDFAVDGGHFQQHIIRSTAGKAPDASPH